MPAAMKQVAALVVLSAAFPSAGHAHAILVDSTPAVHGVVGAGSSAVTLRFNSRIDRDRSRLTLIAADDHTPVRLPVGGDSPPDILTSTLNVTSGAYTLRWQVLAVDGHITRGDVPFTVTKP